ncbi:MAG TPA: TIGR03668 family PPOX class F420-dependent oxidoreductase [Streptosporangiaceae bacterium]|nr:TIGR03668 family PPOX class F420-dependent oxidoreductase [Streptosporangiaceae bacterium]
MRMTEGEARTRFGASRVARLATTGADGRPHLVPVTFALDGDTVATAIDHKPKSTQDLRRLHNIREHPSVCLLADHYAEDWSRLWWARADGDARIVTDPGDCAAPSGWLAAKYAQYQEQPPTGPVILVTIDRWTGWQASPA